jgi:hypothetical protein
VLQSYFLQHGHGLDSNLGVIKQMSIFEGKYSKFPYMFLSDDIPNHGALVDKSVTNLFPKFGNTLTQIMDSCIEINSFFKL